MGKYEPLTRYLESIEGDSWEGNFANIERILGFPLPDSAHQYQAWWANQSGPGHSQTHGWQDAGFETRNLNMTGKRIRFERVKRLPRLKPTPNKEKPDLWSQASEITGIGDRDELMELALMALIQREAGRALIRMGGSMPDLVVPGRERPAV